MAGAILPIPTDAYNLGFIGAGKMAESIARGVVKSGILPASRIRTAHLGAARRAAFESFGVKVLDLNSQVVEDCDVIIFSVKPQIVKEVILKLRPLLSERQLLVSVAAGVKLNDLQEWAGHGRFIRVMPNTPAAVGQAASVMSLGTAAREDDGELIARLFGAIGKIWKANEKLFDGITGLSGSGPAYIYLAIEALADGGVAAGLPRELALGLASQTDGVCGGSGLWLCFLRLLQRPHCRIHGKDVPIWSSGVSRNYQTIGIKPHIPLALALAKVLGAAAMVTRGGKHPGQLKDDVASPGGTTIAGIHELEKSGFRGILMNAVVSAAKRSEDLSKR